MHDFFNTLIKILVEYTNFGILLLALLTFFITFANFYRNRATIKVVQFPVSESVMIKPDFINTESPDKYWHNEYRLIVDIIITNRSAKSISIIEFSLNQNMKFNSYHSPGKLYQVTVTPKNRIHNSGVVFSGSSKKYLYPIEDRWLQPVLDIPPYTSIRGYLYFHFPDKNMVNKKQNKLDIITSRKKFTTHLNVYEFHESAISPPEEILKARHER